jgi:hypothetical protein
MTLNQRDVQTKIDVIQDNLEKQYGVFSSQLPCRTKTTDPKKSVYSSDNALILSPPPQLRSV